MIPLSHRSAKEFAILAERGRKHAAHQSPAIVDHGCRYIDQLRLCGSLALASGTVLVHINPPLPGCFALPGFGMMPRGSSCGVGGIVPPGMRSISLSLIARGPLRSSGGTPRCAGIFKRHRLIGTKLAKDLVANIDCMEINVSATIRIDEAKAAVGVQSLDDAVELGLSVTESGSFHHCWPIAAQPGGLCRLELYGLRPFIPRVRLMSSSFILSARRTPIGKLLGRFRPFRRRNWRP